MTTININLCVLITSPVVFVNLSKEEARPPYFKAKAPSPPEPTSIAVRASFSRLPDPVSVCLGTASTLTDPPTDPPTSYPIQDDRPPAEPEHLGKLPTCPEELPRSDEPVTDVRHGTPHVGQDKICGSECSASQSKPIFDSSEETSSQRDSVLGDVEIRQSLLDSLDLEEPFAEHDTSPHRSQGTGNEDHQEARQVFQTPCIPKVVTVGNRSRPADLSFSDSPTSLDSAIGMDNDAGCAHQDSRAEPEMMQSEMAMSMLQWHIADNAPWETPLASVPKPWTMRSRSPSIVTDEGCLQSNPTPSENEASPEKEVLEPKPWLSAPRLCLIPATEPSTPVEASGNPPAPLPSSPASGGPSQSPKRTAYADSFVGHSPPLGGQTAMPRRADDTRLQNGSPQPNVFPIQKRQGRFRRNQMLVDIASDRSDHRLHHFPAATFPPPINSRKANALTSQGCRSSSLPQGRPHMEWSQQSGPLTSLATSPASRAREFESAETIMSPPMPYSKYHRRSQLSSSPRSSGQLPLRPGKEKDSTGRDQMESPPVPEKDARFLPKTLSPPTVKQFDPATQTPPLGSGFTPRFAPYRREPGRSLVGVARPAENRSDRDWDSRMTQRHRAQSDISAYHQHGFSGSNFDLQTQHHTEKRHLHYSDVNSIEGSPNFPRLARRLDFDAVAERVDQAQCSPKAALHVVNKNQSVLLSPTLPRSPDSPPLPISTSAPGAPVFDDEDYLMARSFYTTPAPCKNPHGRSRSDWGMHA